MEETRQCPFCDEAVRSKAIKCKHCNEPIEPGICIKCRKQNRTGARFCGWCGSDRLVWPVGGRPAEKRAAKAAPPAVSSGVIKESQPPSGSAPESGTGADAAPDGVEDVASAPAEAESGSQPETQGSSARGLWMKFVKDSGEVVLKWILRIISMAIRITLILGGAYFFWVAGTGFHLNPPALYSAILSGAVVGALLYSGRGIDLLLGAILVCVFAYVSFAAGLVVSDSKAVGLYAAIGGVILAIGMIWEAGGAWKFCVKMKQEVAKHRRGY